MAQRKINKSDHPTEYLPFIGDYFYSLYDKDWAKDFKWGVNLSLLPEPSFTFLREVVNLSSSWVKGLKNEVIYYCPFSQNKYFGAIPVAYLANKKPSLPEPNKEMPYFIWDLLMEGDPDLTTLNHVSDINRSLLGHGWRAKELAEGDNDPKITDVVTQLTQDEFIIFKTWRTKDL